MSLLKRVEALAEAREKATEGEWLCEDCNVENCWCCLIDIGDGDPNNYVIPSGNIQIKDATFIALAANEILPIRDEFKALVASIKQYDDAFKSILEHKKGVSLTISWVQVEVIKHHLSEFLNLIEGGDDE